MRNNAHLEYMDCYMPETMIDVDDILYDLNKDIDTEAFKNATQMQKVSVFQNEDILQIMDDMIDNMISKTNIDLTQIKYIICGSHNMTHFKSISIVHYLHKKHNMKEAKILTINQPCAASLYAMGLSQKLLTENDTYALVLCMNNWSDNESENNLASRFLGFTIMGDAIGLLLIGNKKDSDKMQIVNWTSYNDGISSLNRGKARAFTQKPELNRLSMIKGGVKFIEESLRKSNVSFNDIQKIIVPNVRQDVFVNSYSTLLRISPDIFYVRNMKCGGHANDIDVIRNLIDYFSEYNIEKNKYICLYSVDLEITFDTNYHMVLIK